MKTGAGSYQRDIYSCVSCKGWVGRDNYCRYCGHKFDNTDTDQMIDKSAQEKYNAPEHNWCSEIYKCQWCKEPLSVKHKFCKACGYEITDGDRFEMIKPNEFAYTGPLVFVAILVVFTILVLVTLLT